MRFSLRLLVAVTLAAVACGTSAGTEATNPAGPDSGVDATFDADVASGDPAFPRTISHDQGETTIPAAPERVVVLDTGELDTVAALGIEPVGAVRAPVESGFLEYLSDETRKTALVGTISEPDLEAIAGLRPDLILSSTLRHEDIYDELSAIAPTVFSEAVGVVWKDNLLLHAAALGREEQAQHLLDEYEARAAALGASLAADGALPTVSMVRFLPGSTRLYQKASFIGTVLEDVGLPRPESQDVDDFALEVSPEQVELMDGDVIFHTTYGPDDESTQPEIVGSDLWQSLSAVRSGDVHEVADDHWMLGIGIRAATLVLDDLEAVLG